MIDLCDWKKIYCFKRGFGKCIDLIILGNWVDLFNIVIECYVF